MVQGGSNACTVTLQRKMAFNESQLNYDLTRETWLVIHLGTREMGDRLPVFSQFSIIGSALSRNHCQKPHVNQYVCHKNTGMFLSLDLRASEFAFGGHSENVFFVEWVWRELSKALNNTYWLTCAQALSAIHHYNTSIFSHVKPNQVWPQHFERQNMDFVAMSQPSLHRFNQDQCSKRNADFLLFNVLVKSKSR